MKIVLVPIVAILAVLVMVYAFILPPILAIFEVL